MPFDPSTIPWSIVLDPHTSATTDTAQTTPCTSGTNIGAIGDSSGNSRHFTQATTAKQLFAYTGFGGLLCAVNPGDTNRNVNIADSADIQGLQNNANGYALWVVYQVFDPSAYCTIVGKAPNAGNDQRWWLQDDANAGGIRRYSSTTIERALPGRLNIACYNFVPTQSADVGYGRWWVNGGIRSASDTEITLPAVEAASPLCLGALSTNTSSFYGHVAIYQFRAINRSLTTAELLNMDSYAYSRWGKRYPVVVNSGNSIAAGVGGAVPPAAGKSYFELTRTNSGPSQVAWKSTALTSQTYANMATRDATLINPAANSAIAEKLIVMGYEGQNSLSTGGQTAAQCYADMVTWATARKTARADTVVITATAVDGTADATKRAAFNALVKADFTIPTAHPLVYLAAPTTAYANICIDWGNDAAMGPAGSKSNTALFNTDTIHPKAAGHARMHAAAQYAVQLAQLLAYSPAPSRVLNGTTVLRGFQTSTLTLGAATATLTTQTYGVGGTGTVGLLALSSVKTTAGGTLDMSLYTLVSGVVGPSYVLIGRDNYTGGLSGTLTLPSAAAVLSTQTYGVGGNGSTGAISLDSVISTAGGNWVVVTSAEVNLGTSFGINQVGLLSSSTPISPQDIANAMKLPPTAGAPAPGSIMAILAAQPLKTDLPDQDTFADDVAQAVVDKLGGSTGGGQNNSIEDESASVE